ncbi:MAG TPA: allantoinase AllB [Candidatus Eisenbacteria bacterium]|jgi:allantoinase
MSPAPLVLRSRHTVTPRGIEDAVVVVRDGRIADVLPPEHAAARVAEDLGDLILMPGLVDTHVHVNEPGRTEWEGFETATRAAAVGGVTTIVDMPLNSVPATTSAAALAEKRAAAEGKCTVDVAFWGGVVPGNAGEIEALAAAGVRGFKCFLVPSGVSEFPHVEERDVRDAMPAIARLGLPLLVHAELPGPIEAAARALAVAQPRTHAAWLASRPRAAECEAIAMMLALCKETGCPVHIVHLAAADAVPMLRDARARGLPVTVETCPHYLTFAAEEIADGATTFKCAPPIRERGNRAALWTALGEGVIDLVATDHSPCPPAMKWLESGDFFAAWGGIASLELALAATWTGARERGFTPADLARWMCARPTRLARLETTKGAIAPGLDADLVAWDPEAEWTVDPAALHQRHKVTPYAGRRLAGRVRRTYVRGEPVYRDGRLTGARPGRVLGAGSSAGAR